MTALLGGPDVGGQLSPIQTAYKAQTGISTAPAGGGQVIYMQPQSSGSNSAAIANTNRAGVLSRGRQSTLLTGGGGVSDTINNQRKSLLGE